MRQHHPPSGTDGTGNAERSGLGGDKQQGPLAAGGADTRSLAKLHARLLHNQQLCPSCLPTDNHVGLKKERKTAHSGFS